MKTFSCKCSARLFFHSSHCIACGRVTGMCDQCHEITALEPVSDTVFQCLKCESQLTLCENRTSFDACNGTVAETCEDSLCRFCRLNHIVPDLAITENLEAFRKIERAKHRVLYDCERIGLPVFSDDENELPLQFEFKSSALEPVSTGHADGIITIDIAEANSVVREKNRVEFEEPQRTLVGHFRHELGHYYWQRIVLQKGLDEYRELFGDERDPSYADAQQKYYSQGAPPNWGDRFISRYATMHSWEDFAETFNAYLDMIAIVATAGHFSRQQSQDDAAIDLAEFDFLLKAYTQIGIVANELNRDMGLLDLVPEIFTPPVVEKLRFVHTLAAKAASQSDASSAKLDAPLEKHDASPVKHDGSPEKHRV